MACAAACRFKSCSEEVKELVLSMLDPDPRARPSAAQVLAHRWIKEACAAAEVPPVAPRESEATLGGRPPTHADTIRKRFAQVHKLR